jgi:hypothetical protein
MLISNINYRELAYLCFPRLQRGSALRQLASGGVKRIVSKGPR